MWTEKAIVATAGEFVFMMKRRRVGSCWYLGQFEGSLMHSYIACFSELRLAPLKEIIFTFIIVWGSIKDRPLELVVRAPKEAAMNQE